VPAPYTEGHFCGSRGNARLVLPQPVGQSLEWGPQAGVSIMDSHSDSH